MESSLFHFLNFILFCVWWRFGNRRQPPCVSLSHFSNSCSSTQCCPSREKLAQSLADYMMWVCLEGHSRTRAFVPWTPGWSAALAAEFAGRRQMRAGEHLRREGREERSTSCWDALGCSLEPSAPLCSLPFKPNVPKGTGII